MPQTELIFYQEDEEVPVLEWLEDLRDSDKKAYAKCVVRIRQLADMGHQLRRPAADYLDGGIYELRAKQGRVNYRILYFFHGKDVAILAHAITKEDKIPKTDLKRAVERKEKFEKDPEKHSHEEDLDDE